MKQGLQLAFAGTVVYSTLFLTVKFLTKKALANKYPRHDVLDVANKLVSSMHAVFSSVAGLVITLNCKDIKYDRHWMTNGFAWFGFPYFLYDVLCMFYVYQSNPENEGKPVLLLFWKFLCSKPVIVAHHFVLAFLALPAIVLNMKGTRLYAVNGVLMIVTFFFCRICLFPYLYYTYSVYAGLTILQVFTHIPKKCNASSAVFVLFQLYWFWLMLMGAWKLMWKKRNPSQESVKFQ